MPTPTTILRHGYTMRDLHDIARYAVSRNGAYRTTDPDERYAAAWHAAAETLYAAETKPARRDLTQAAWNACDQATRRMLADCGVPPNATTRLPRFHTYWHLASSPTASPEDRVVEVLALRQIWERLTPKDRTALAALAVHDDYQTAADSLGLKYYTFCQHVRHARIRFHRLWLEGETPRKSWRDQRAKRGEGPKENVSAFIRRRRREAAAA
ncbi:hypothetical protein OG601_47185 [Streptomyces sp. NBC_01239]|uniref:hypothetical protein n=1 Tax=Streptomyces sp. NBC_01239 TaxID=2903792 RepID=UPI0022546C84|nr:hypothetical protein [Streptomyces sp. NBC_01239]MCX4809023.1 hypothetical protein [Streptomyces sp. NBC_01239]MCX4818159.1 hypothetical protein [Streptomyces sp. NBC_01239]